MQYCFHPVLMPLDFICRSEHPPLSFTKSGNAKKNTHPEGLHSFLPGGRSSRLFRGTIPMAACMMVINFLNFIFYLSVNSITASSWLLPTLHRC